MAAANIEPMATDSVSLRVFAKSSVIFAKFCAMAARGSGSVAGFRAAYCWDANRVLTSIGFSILDGFICATGPLGPKTFGGLGRTS